MISGEPLEIEAKFAVWNPELVGALIRRPPTEGLAAFVPVDEAHLVDIVDRYMDTAPVGGALAAAGMRARLRDGADGVSLHVKRRGTDLDGITTRVELTGPATATLDASAWPDSAALRALREMVGDRPLVPVAAIRQRRLTRAFANGASTVEMSLDEVEVLAPTGPVARRHELEVELKAGAASDLGLLAAALARIEGLGPPYGSKLEFAMASIGGARST